MTRLFVTALAALSIVPLPAQDDDTPPPERASKPPVTLIFTPPALEGDIVLGIFDAAGRPRRTLRFEPGAPGLFVDTNGYIVKWDGLDDAGKACPAGRYSAHGYVVGDEVRIEGEAFYFNDWMAEDRIPAASVSLREWPDGPGVALRTANGVLYRRIQADGALAEVRDPMDWAHPRPPKLAPPTIAWAKGRDGTWWTIREEGGQHVVAQFGKDDNAPLRELRVPRDEPQPVEILASPTEDAILLKEIGASGEQRVRLLERGATAAEQGGRIVADWEVAFERTLQPCANFGVVNGKLEADGGAAAQYQLITVPLVENVLEPGRKMELRLAAVPTHPGSAFATAPQAGAMGGLAVVKISDEGNWNRVLLGDDSKPTDFSVYQGDGVVVEEFRVKNLDHIAAFDAGTFLLAPAAQ